MTRPDRSQPPGLAASARQHLGAVRVMFGHEWRVLLYSPRTYIVQASLLLALAVGVFQIGGLYDSDYASLDILWSILPAVAVAFVPAIGARAFAQEDGSRELEIVQTLPLSDWDIVLGKWLAGAAFLCLTLAFTWPMAAIVAYLGTPDWGALASGALGAALFLVACLAVAMFCSALTGEQVSAYVLSIVLLMALIALGWDALPRFFSLSLAISEPLQLLSPKLAHDRLASGRIDLAALLALVVETLAALAGCVAILRLRRTANAWQVRLSLASLQRTALPVLIGAALLVAAQMSGASIDATSDRRFTLSPATIELARALPADTKIDFYWSEGDTSVPAAIRAHAQDVRNMLSLIAASSHGRARLKVHVTEPDGEEEWNALAAGMRRVPLSSGGSFFLGATIGAGARNHQLAYLDERSSRDLEYEMALAMSRLARAHVPKVGLLSPLVPPSELGEGRSHHSFIETLRKSADVAVVPFFADTLPDDLDVLVLVGSAPVKREMLVAIDQLVMRGKGLVVLLDPLMRFNPTGKANSPSSTGELNTIADLIARYGIAFDADIVGDTELAAEVAGQDGGNRQVYPFWIRVSQAQVAPGYSVALKLVDAVLVEAGSLRVSGTARPIITTTAHSGAVPADGFSLADITANAAKLKPDGKIRTLAASAAGPLASPFADALKDRPGFIARSGTSASVYVVADADWIFDAVATADAGGGERRPVNDNLAMLATIVDLSVGDQRLLSIRGRTQVSRRFTRIDDLLRANRATFKGQESTVLAKIEKVEATIAQVLQATKAKSIDDLPREIREHIAKVYSATIPLRKTLRDIRFSMRKDVEQLGRWLTALGLASGPLFSLALWGVVGATRRWTVAGRTRSR